VGHEHERDPDLLLANGWSGFIDGAIESGLSAGAWSAAST
jgi:hypothetical protein